MKKEIKKRVVKDQSGDKVADCMHKFKAGKLKDSGGNIVTDKNQAIAIALNQAGLSNKDLQKAEIRNKLRMYRGELSNLLKKELQNDQSIKAEIIKLFKNNNVTDNDVHALAERLQISPHDMEDQIYNILRSFLSGGLSQGKVESVDPNELAMGIKVESEHTDDPTLQEKIARDHLKENPKYYTDLKQIEKPSEMPAEKSGAPAMAPVPMQPTIIINKPTEPAMDDEAKKMAGELPGNLPRESEELFAKIYFLDEACHYGVDKKSI